MTNQRYTTTSERWGAGASVSEKGLYVADAAPALDVGLNVIDAPDFAELDGGLSAIAASSVRGVIAMAALLLHRTVPGSCDSPGNAAFQ